MPSITLITTGDLEYHALGPSLKRVFPQAEFELQLADSFTSSRVKYPPDDPHRESTKAEELAARLVQAVDTGRSGTRSDFAVAIDDLELCNVDQPEIVIDVFHRAVARHLEGAWSSGNRRKKACENALAKCSFHLFVPMAEAYLFGDPGALKLAGATRNAALPADIDLEEFRVADEAYLAEAKNEQDRQLRATHPKRYLKYLTEAKYRERRDGGRALTGLDWGSVLKSPPRVRFLRSMFTDIADMLQMDPPFPIGPPALTWNPGARNSLLRNFGPRQ